MLIQPAAVLLYGMPVFGQNFFEMSFSTCYLAILSDRQEILGCHEFHNGP